MNCNRLSCMQLSFLQDKISLFFDELPKDRFSSFFALKMVPPFFCFRLVQSMTNAAKQRDRGTELSFPSYARRVFPKCFGEILASQKHFASDFSGRRHVTLTVCKDQSTI